MDIPGRHVIDTLMLVQSYDSTRRTMESHGLKYAAQYFGFASPDRTYIQGDRIAWHWDNDPAPLLAYALDDVHETGALSAHLSPTSFYLAQMVPASLGHVVRMGAAAKIECLMVRAYLQAKHSIPQAAAGGADDRRLHRPLPHRRHRSGRARGRGVAVSFPHAHEVHRARHGRAGVLPRAPEGPDLDAPGAKARAGRRHRRDRTVAPGRDAELDEDSDQFVLRIPRIRPRASSTTTGRRTGSRQTGQEILRHDDGRDPLVGREGG